MSAFDLTYPTAGTVWADESKVELLRELWSTGRSCSQIALVIGGGVTRSAIIGKVHRLGLAPRKQASLNPGGHYHRKRSYSAQEITARDARRREREADYRRGKSRPVPLSKIQETPAIISNPCTLLELTPERCRWPIGDPREAGFHFCGGAAQERFKRFKCDFDFLTASYEPYCAGHLLQGRAPPNTQRDVGQFVPLPAGAV